jgi:ribosomal protein S18 acetylase RimI-like enzyme
MEARESQPGDEAAIDRVTISGLATLRRTYRPAPAAIERKAARSLRRLVAIDADAIVGTVEYAIDDHRLHAIGLHVLETHRRRGVARCLIDALATIATRAGARKLSLYTIRETGNVEVFERLGFTVIAETPAGDLVGESHERLTEVYMERPPA